MFTIESVLQSSTATELNTFDLLPGKHSVQDQTK